MRRQVVSRSEAETEAFGRALGEALHTGSIVLLIGDLGAGKTALVRGMAAGLGVDAREVSSPTFTLIQQYHGRVTLYHVDLYRLAGGADVDDLGLEELAESGAVAIEWAEKMPRPVPAAIVVHLEDRGGDERLITVVRPDPDQRAFTAPD